MPHSEANVFDQFDAPNVFDQFDTREEVPTDGPLAGFSTPRAAFGAPTIVSAAVAQPVSGLAGLFAIPVGFIGGLAPGGESPLEKGRRFGEVTQRGVEEFITIPPTLEGERILEGVSKVGRAVSAPIAAIATGSLEEDFGGRRPTPETAAFRSPEAVTAARERVLEEGLTRAAGGTVLEATGSPLLATVAETIPAGIASLFGARALRTRVPEPPTPPRIDQPTPVVSVGAPRLDRPVDFTPEQIVERIKKGKPKAVAEATLPDIDIVESAQRLGIDLNPEHYSTNTAFQDVARALKAKPGSKLQASEVAALEAVATRADDLVEEIGGSLDKASVSENIRLQTQSTIDDLQTKADVAYGQVREAIPASTRVETANIKQHIDGKLAELGGDKKLLSTSERKLFNLINRKGAKGGITYAALDRVRRDVGNGFNKRKGPFADDDDRILREVYGVLSDAQNNAASAFGVGDLYAGARGLVVKRKAIEDSAVELFGRNVSNSLVPKFRQAAAGLTKGDVTAFNKLMEALPEPRRAEVAATVLGDLFAGGSRRGGQLGTGFVASFEALNRNAVAKTTLFRHLPKEARQRFDDIGRVLTGIVTANRKSLSNPSGSAGPIIAALESGSLAGRIFNVAKKVIPAEAVSTAIGLPGAGTAGVIGGILSKTKTPAITAADNFLTSPEFSRAMKEAINGNASAANRIVENSPRFKQWLKTADENTTQKIAATGFISWLSAEDEL